jgi:hypothetical protein
MTEQLHSCWCNGGRPTTHALHVQKNGVGKVIAKAFYCTNCGTHKAPAEEVDLATRENDAR